MALTTIGPVADRIYALVLASGYARSNTPFDFDHQPAGALDRYFHGTSERVETNGYIGGDQAEVHKFTIYFAQRTKRDAWGAARQLLVDMDIVEQAVKDDGAVYDYHLLDDGVTTETQTPGADDDFVVTRLELTVELDREM